MRRLLLCLALVFTLSAKAPMTSITIEIKNQNGKPVDNASVVVKFIKGRDVFKLGKGIRREWEVRSNQEGSVKIPAIPQGQILIQVIAKNYQTFGQTFEVDEEQKTISITLNH